MSYNLFLDDLRQPAVCDKYMKVKIYEHTKWEVVRNFEQFTRIIKHKGIPDLISFDHDLADEHYAFRGRYEELTEETGMHCLVWLTEYVIDNKIEGFPKCIFHTMNPVGMNNMKSYYRNFLKHRALWDISKEPTTPTDKWDVSSWMAG